ncbi:hypothetical protein GCM10009843_25760 [Nocardioides bigeumensis]|uniref:PqqD family protein n=1 Tax=Nocardioides bigeumensis TaxID=433657 RepID=A0ABP5K422_9ACTN
MHDVYDDGDECVVFVGDDVLALSVRATAAYRAVSGGHGSVEGVARALQEALGEPPPDVALLDVTNETLRELAEIGLIKGSGRGRG